MLAEAILADEASTIRLKGIAIGNGCWGSTVGLCSFGPDMQRIWQQFLYGHSAIPKRRYAAIAKACGDPAHGPGSWSNCSGQGPGCSGPYASMLRGSDKYRSSECQELLQAVAKDEGQGNYELYNYYDTCYATSGMLESAAGLALEQLLGGEFEMSADLHSPYRSTGMSSAGRAAHISHMQAGGVWGAAVHVGQAPLTESGALNDYSCGGMSAMGKWLSHPEVQKALHVNPAHPYPGACSYLLRAIDLVVQKRLSWPAF